MRVPRSVPRKSYMVTYESLSDPGAADVASVMARLGRFKPVEVLPGTFKVVGPPAAVRKAAEQLSGWRVAPVGVFSSRPPSRRAS